MEDGGHSYGRITLEDLEYLAGIARLDREDFFARMPRYLMLERGLICVALCQGAALHFVGGENGVKDFDVWTFYASRPGHPAFPWRRRKARVFGDPAFGRPPDGPDFSGRYVDLLGRSVEGGSRRVLAHLEDAGAPARVVLVGPREAKTSATGRSMMTLSVTCSPAPVPRSAGSSDRASTALSTSVLKIFSSPRLLDRGSIPGKGDAFFDVLAICGRFLLFLREFSPTRGGTSGGGPQAEPEVLREVALVGESGGAGQTRT